MKPIVREEDKSIIWNNLPYAGVYNEPFFVTGENTTPFNKVSLLEGIPLKLENTGVNKDLRLIGFKEKKDSDPWESIFDGPVSVSQEWRIIAYSTTLEYRVKWRVSQECKIGFYVSNYLLDTEIPERKTLLLSTEGPCLFEGKCGSFQFTDNAEFCVITDKEVIVSLEVKCRVPLKKTSYPELQLFEPVPYRLSNECVYAYETKLNEISRDASFVPTKKYIELTEAIRKYLTDTSILLQFKDALLRENGSSIEFGNLNTYRELRGNRVYNFGVLFTGILPTGWSVTNQSGLPLILNLPAKTDNTVTTYVNVKYTINVTYDAMKQEIFPDDEWGKYFRVSVTNGASQSAEYTLLNNNTPPNPTNKQLSNMTGSFSYVQNNNEMQIVFFFGTGNRSALLTKLVVEKLSIVLSDQVINV